ncbi:MAG: hypothetical protein BLM47_01940 [Candidatus Reconcilbacillus cellulovorans]|uniref:Uncharacterized protein n=1 Tax=Candidatus Reconcilbacillus cellulovorans TaxID=1906605 RepID=A0A2A6E305_9BACL|nr:MAG: hypothetical protein BLM47_01940 [Candidatus Reconcilbacillus cellulovorans]
MERIDAAGIRRTKRSAFFSSTMLMTKNENILKNMFCLSTLSLRPLILRLRRTIPANIAVCR